MPLFLFVSSHLLGPLSPQNVTVTHVTPTEIFLHWDAPDPVSFDHYFVVLLDPENAKSEEVFVEKPNTSTTIGNLKSFHHYLIYLFSVAERGTLSYFEKPVSAITGMGTFCLLISTNSAYFEILICGNLIVSILHRYKMITVEHLSRC